MVWNGYNTHGPNGAEWLQYPWAQWCGMVTISMGPTVWNGYITHEPTGVLPVVLDYRRLLRYLSCKVT